MAHKKDRAVSREETAHHAKQAVALGVGQDGGGFIEHQDVAFAGDLGTELRDGTGEAIDRLYAARDALTAALERAGATADGVRRILRLAIADDLHAAARLRGEDAP